MSLRPEFAQAQESAVDRAVENVWNEGAVAVAEPPAPAVKAAPAPRPAPMRTAPPAPTPAPEPVAQEEETPAEVETPAAEAEPPAPAINEPVPQANNVPVDDDNPLELSPEDYAQVRSNPTLAKFYKSMQKAFTQKTQEIADVKRLVTSLQDPKTSRATLAAIAGAMGERLADGSIPAQAAAAPAAQVAAAVQDELERELASTFDPTVSKALAAGLRGPVAKMLESQVGQLRSQLNAEVNQQREVIGQLLMSEKAAESTAEIKGFWATHPGERTQELEDKMAALMPRLQPSDEMSTGEYLESLYRVARGEVRKSEAVKEVAARMQKAAATQEPRGGTNAARVQAAKPAAQSGFGAKDADRRLDAAFDAAFNDIVAGR